MREVEIDTLRARIVGLLGKMGRVAYDPGARVMTLVATRIPAPPVTLQFFDDGCVHVLTGAAAFFVIADAVNDQDHILGIVRAIVEGRCEEGVAASEEGGLRIHAGVTTSQGGFAQSIPEDGRLVTWRLPSWGGSDTAAVVEQRL